ncbi:MAG: esterase family protein [Bacteroidaceae bacterium]|nr:esterase family protein [Bacteroidaceae bacterium]
MKRTIILMALLAISVASWSRVITDSIKSNVLKATVKVNIYLPEEFDRQPQKKYPVLYLLHGLTDTYLAWVDKGHLDKVADEMISKGEVCPMIIIMPNAGGPNTRVDWNGYFNMDGWAYHDFFYQELMPTFEKKYRIIGDKANRAVSGLSMGGGGCTVYAQRHPDLFSSCYAMSAWLTSQDTQVNPNDHQTAVSKAVHDNSAIDYVRNASAEVVNQLKTVRWFVDCGDDDFLLDQNEEFHRLMRGKRIACELRVRNGNHGWDYWNTALRTSLPFAAQSFNK